MGGDLSELGKAAQLVLLGELRQGQRAVVAKLASPLSTEKVHPSGGHRLLEMGLLVGSEVEVVHEAPFWGDPIAVRVRGTLIAMRRSEANQILVWVKALCT
jgi:ferrous iron transport protein A